MNDLLGDTQSDTRHGNVDLEIGVSPSPSSSPTSGSSTTDLSTFFQDVNDIKNSMTQIRKSLQKLQQSHEETKTVTKADVMKELKEKMDKEMDNVNKIAQTLKVKVEALDKANILNRKEKGCGEGSSTDRTRMAITATLKKKLKGIMQDFQQLREKFQDEYREVVERRIFTVTGQKADEATIERLIDTGDSDQIFQKAIQEQGRGQILDTVAEIQERQNAVRDIEKKLLELHQVFLDMAVLVEAQGELLDNIETQLSKAVEHVNTGTAALQKAKQFQRGTRKCMCIAMIVLLIVIVIIVVAVLQPWKNGSA